MTAPITRQKFLWNRIVGAMAVASATGLALAPLANAADPRQKQEIIFVCLHGSVKSQVAAAHFNRIAKERGLPLEAVSRGMTLDPSIPASIRQGLATDGLRPLDDVPKPLTASEVGTARTIIAFDAVPRELVGGATVIQWSNVPAATKDYDAARNAIVHNIEGLLGDLKVK